MKLPKFKVLTGKSVLEIPYENEEEYEKDILTMVEEHNNILAQHMYKQYAENYLIHFFDSVFFDETYMGLEICDAIECLAIKDGYDLVQYENGNIGIVAYYNGNNNGFEIIRDRYL